MANSINPAYISISECKNGYEVVAINREREEDRLVFYTIEELCGFISNFLRDQWRYEIPKKWWQVNVSNY